MRAGHAAEINPVAQSLRLVEIHAPDSSVPRRRMLVDSKSKTYRTDETDHTFLLLTDLLDIVVRLVGSLYRYR